MAGVAARYGKAEIQRLDLSIRPRTAKRAKHARPGLSIGQVDAKLFEQPRRSDQHVLLAHDGFDKRGVRAVHRRLEDGRQQFRTPDQRLIEPLQELTLEPCRERRTGLIDNSC